MSALGTRRPDMAGPSGPPKPSRSQLEAIEAAPGPVLVLAGPGAGKTFCLAERIRFLIEKKGFDPSRICAFTFTNKAAGEIASRLAPLGERAARVKGGTVHAYCAELLREFGSHVGLRAGFGIADEEYQEGVLRRLEVPPRFRPSVLKRFTAHRFKGEELWTNDVQYLARYMRFLDERNIVDFDTLVLKAAELLEKVRDVSDVIRARWDCVLVDEFQDLNPVQYSIVRELGRDHRNIFAVGDDEQSIYSWTGADPKVFRDFANDFEMRRIVHLQENRRCSRQIFTLARRLVMFNTPLFSDRVHAEVKRESEFAVAALTFATNDEEVAWIIKDLRRDLERHGLPWGEAALLYRRHDVGDILEAAFLTAGIPCRLAQGRALSEDPVMGYLLAALRVIANPRDPVFREGFFGVVLPKPLMDRARIEGEERGQNLLERLHQIAVELPDEHVDAKKIRRGLAVLRNLPAIGSRHTSLTTLIDELLSQRVGEYRSVLEERADVLEDPAGIPEVVSLATRLRAAAGEGRPIWIPTLRGAGIPIKAILLGVGLRQVVVGGAPPLSAERVDPSDFPPTLGIALGMFKTAQLIASNDFTDAFRDFTAFDLETTDKNPASAEIVEIAAVRVRQGKIVDQYQQLVRPSVPIHPKAVETHHITESDVANEPSFAQIWPRFREFCGDDVLVAHNGYHFDFRILRRMAREVTSAGADDLLTYDTLPLARELHTGSAKLPDLATHFGVDTGQSHRALADCRALVGVFNALNKAKLARARKTTLVHLLDQLGVANALCDQSSPGSEAQELARPAQIFALGRYSESLDFYHAERKEMGDESIPTIDELIERLGGPELMNRIRAEKSAMQRYPAAMARMRRLLDQAGSGSLSSQIESFLERAVLSRWDGADQDQERVNLLTLHATKGLEFSRVYVVGVEDEQFIGGGGKSSTASEVEEARRLVYVGMTRAKDRLVLTRADVRQGKPTGGHQFFDEMGLVPGSAG